MVFLEPRVVVRYEMGIRPNVSGVGLGSSRGTPVDWVL